VWSLDVQQINPEDGKLWVFSYQAKAKGTVVFMDDPSVNLKAPPVVSGDPNEGAANEGTSNEGARGAGPGATGPKIRTITFDRGDTGEGARGSGTSGPDFSQGTFVVVNSGFGRSATKAPPSPDDPEMVAPLPVYGKIVSEVKTAPDATSEGARGSDSSTAESFDVEEVGEDEIFEAQEAFQFIGTPEDAQAYLAQVKQETAAESQPSGDGGPAADGARGSGDGITMKPAKLVSLLDTLTIKAGSAEGARGSKQVSGTINWEASKKFTASMQPQVVNFNKTTTTADGKKEVAEGGEGAYGTFTVNGNVALTLTTKIYGSFSMGAYWGFQVKWDGWWPSAIPYVGVWSNMDLNLRQDIKMEAEVSGTYEFPGPSFSAPCSPTFGCAGVNFLGQSLQLGIWPGVDLGLSIELKAKVIKTFAFEGKIFGLKNFEVKGDTSSGAFSMKLAKTPEFSGPSVKMVKGKPAVGSEVVSDASMAVHADGTVKGSITPWVKAGLEAGSCSSGSNLCLKALAKLSYDLYASIALSTAYPALVAEEECPGDQSKLRFTLGGESLKGSLEYAFPFFTGGSVQVFSTKALDVEIFSCRVCQILSASPSAPACKI